jgi:rSAM/selenodomain-associated transferase 1
VVMARWPVMGRCKRRLAAGIGGRSAALVQRRLTEHTVASCLSVAALGDGRLQPQILLAADPLGPAAARRWARQLGVQRGLPQGQGCLGLRMRRQLERAWREGSHQVVVIGSDLPELEPGDLVEAFLALERSSLVLGPAADGGYWLIGLSHRASAALASALFSGMPWGSAKVLEQTMAAAHQLGVEPALLIQRRDLDRPADLRPWR